MSDEPPGARATSEGEASTRAEGGSEGRVAAVLRTFFEDSSLWPVLAVAVLILATLLCALLVLAFSDRNLAAIAATAGVVFLSYQACESDVRARTLGPGTWIALGIWGLALSGWVALRWSSAV